MTTFFPYTTLFGSGSLVIAPVARRGVGRVTFVVGLEVGRVFSGVDRLGKRIAGLRTDRATREGADDRAGRTRDGSHCAARHRTGNRARACTTAVVLLDVAHRVLRSEERRVGTEWVSTCRSRWATENSQKKTNTS